MLVNEKKKAEKAIDDLLKCIISGKEGENIDREGLRDTPKRVRKAWEYWTSGYNRDVKDVLTTFKDDLQHYNQMVLQTNINFFSTCEHHLAPFWGVVHIAYIPYDLVVGLSKFARVVDIFARRLQLQERLTTDIARALQENLQPRGVAVVVKARHSCIESRGIEKIGSATLTSHLEGVFKEDLAVRQEFFRLVQMAEHGRNQF